MESLGPFFIRAFHNKGKFVFLGLNIMNRQVRLLLIIFKGFSSHINPVTKASYANTNLRKSGLPGPTETSGDLD